MAAMKTDHPLERLVFFSDAVFAIAITLLVIELHPPHLDRHASDQEHWQALRVMIPQFAGYVISFAIIGVFWMGHHRAFALATRHDRAVVKWNLLMLMVIAFMPFVTAYYSAFLGARVPILLYCGAMLLAALLNRKVNRLATGPTMVSPDASPEAIAYVRMRGNALVLGSATAVGMCYVYPEFAQAGLASIPLWRRILILVAKRRGGPIPKDA